MAFKKLIKCPICGVPNRFGDEKCKICKNQLPQEERERQAPDKIQRQQRSARPPPRNREHRTGRVGRSPPTKAGSGPRPRPPARRPPGKRPPRRPPGKRQRPPRDRRPAPPRESEAQRPERPDPPQPKQPEGEVSRILAWLCCDPLPPLPLGPKPTLTIGRGDGCDLVLPHKEVSRYHALIKIRGRKLIQFEDEGSSNGSYLNGRRISSSSLKIDDKLTLGPYDLQIRSNEEMAARHGEETTKTKAFEITKSRDNPNAIMSGNLKEVPLSELFQALEFNKRTGTLTVLGKTHKGVLALEKGRPVGATMDGRTGEEAVLRMLTLRKGRFSLSSTAEEIEGEQDIQRSLTALLFEASRRVDEDDSEETAA